MKHAIPFFLFIAMLAGGCMTHTRTEIRSNGPSHELPSHLTSGRGRPVRRVPERRTSVRSQGRNAAESGFEAVQESRDGVRVDVYADGRIELYRTPVTREQLVRRLAREERGSNEQGGVEMASQRAVILHAHKGVRKAVLADLRSFLVRNRVPNVVLVTERNLLVDSDD